MTFVERLAAVAAETETVLHELLSPAPNLAVGEPVLWEAMQYSTLGGGKRLRAFLAVEGAEMLGVPRDRALRAAAAVECVHAYSLVHDDLPAMDDDDLRRGKPTTHKKYDEASAILAGDALQARAFEILADEATHPDGAVRAELCLGLAVAGGAPGMVGGQMIDIAAETASEPFDLQTITRLQALKTGALIRFSSESGAILAADPQARTALRQFAEHVGLAFQIRDDLLDVEGDENLAGKRLQKDANAGKATFVSELGVDGARAAAEKEVDDAKAALSSFSDSAGWLCAAADFAIHRHN